MGKIIKNTLILTKLPKNPSQEPKNRQKKKHGRLYSVM